MENIDNFKRILLNMNYDSKKTLSENVEGVLLNESYPVKVITSGGWNGPDKGTNFSIDKYTLKHKDTNFVLIDTKLNGFLVTLRYTCGEQSLSIQASPNNQFTGTIIDSNSLEQKLEIDYCRKKGDDMLSDNMFWKKGEDLSGRWVELYNALLASGFSFKLLDKDKKATTDPKLAYQMWWRNFIINRNLGKYTFITFGSPATVYANLMLKYTGQKDLGRVTLKITKGYTDTDLMSLKAFLEKDWKTTSKKEEKVIDYTQEKKKSGGSNTNTSNQNSTGWNTTCKGTYSMGCKTSEVGQAQQCLKDDGLYPYRVDDKFGSKTRDAVKAKIGKTYFTDADLQTICKTKQGGGGDDLSDFNNDGNQEKGGNQELEDKTWVGDVY